MSVEKVTLTLKQVGELVDQLAHYDKVRGLGKRIYGIPRGGVVPAVMLAERYGFIITDTPESADFFVDDIIDSGATAERYHKKYNRPTIALIDKRGKGGKNSEYAHTWVVFPWEIHDGKDDSITDAVVRLLTYVGEDPNRPGLKDTPERFIKALDFFTQGYRMDPNKEMKVFEDGAESYDEMVVVKDLPFYSKCEHHLADIFGTATIAYIPNGKIIGLSKLSRLLDVFARRLQVQERLTTQVASTLYQGLGAKGVGVIVKARHMCMESRGICKQGHHTVTSAVLGAIAEKPEARAEFMSLAKD